jgi:hypothetical protein
VAFEAAFGWGWLILALRTTVEPHLVHPLRCKAIASARLKNDKVDAAILAQLLRADLLPEAWIALPPVRPLRALLRHRASLVRLARSCATGSTRWPLTTAMTAARATGPGRAGLAGRADLPHGLAGIVTDCLAVIDGLRR